MILDKINSVYFLGIGGIGMSALARFFLNQGKQVHGYDLTPSEITSQLSAAGAHIIFEEDATKIPKNIDLVVYTPAVPKEHAAYQYFVKNKIPIFKRSEILGTICSKYPTIAVSGTHGKTTTTAMLTQMLNSGVRCAVSGMRCGVLSFIGGVAKNFNSNFVCEENFDTVIVEADEFDRSFLTLHPQVAVITSMDADHLDVYNSVNFLIESFQLFANQIQPNGVLVIYDEIACQITHPAKITYGFSKQADYQIVNIQYFPTKTTFDLNIKIEKPHTAHRTPLTINIPGKHNVLNAVAALAASLEYLSWKKGAEVDVRLLQTAISEFSGVKRRFDIRIKQDDFVYIDDYAHHPEEIKAFLEAVKKCYPTKKITGVFQPHLYSRTRDFANEFAKALEILDEIILLDIYPAREQPIKGISSQYLLSLIENINKRCLTKKELLPYLQQNKPEVLLTMGAGDIDRVAKEIEATFCAPTS
jgi:UDP-N-acetylmuramate--alanine ligase